MTTEVYSKQKMVNFFFGPAIPTREREIEYCNIIKEYRDCPNHPKVERALIKLAPTCCLILRYYIRRTDLNKTSAEEIASAALQGIWAAALKFDPERGFRFVSFARRYVTDKVTKEVYFNRGSAMYKETMMPTQRRARGQEEEVDLKSKYFINEKGEDIIDLQIDPKYDHKDAVVDLLIEDELRYKINDIIVDFLAEEKRRQLSYPERYKRDETIFIRRWTEDATLVQLSNELGVTRQRVDQIYKRMYQKLFLFAKNRLNPSIDRFML